MTNNLINHVVVYLLYFLDDFGFKQQALVLSDAEGNGEVMAETAYESGIMWGRLAAGGRIEIPFTHYLGAEPARVSVNNGNGVSGHTMSDQQVGNLLNNSPRDASGEVKPTENVERIRTGNGEVIYQKPK